MTTFFLDLWQDLRAKRLWPIAVGLLAATIAIPVLLFKPASSTPSSTGAARAGDANRLPSVNLDASSVDSSHLNVFKEKNPFHSLSDGGTTGATPPTAATGTSIGKSVASAASSSSGSGSSSSGSSGGGTSTGAGGSTPSGPDGNPVKPGVHYFTYTADVRFGRRGKMKTYKGVKELQVLPNGKNPIVSFMGVKDAKTAVFFIADPAFQVDGEGKCQPTRKNCMFLYLKTSGAHDEATLSAQNGQVEYDLRLTGLHVKSISKSQAVGNTTPAKSPSKKAAARRAERDTLLSLPALGTLKR